MGIAVATKNTNWDDEEYNKGVIAPYNEMKNIQTKVEKENRKATVDEMKRTIELLLKIFATKKTPFEEQKSRFEELFADSGEQELFKDYDFSTII